MSKVNYCAKLSAPLHRHLAFVLVGSDLLTSVISNEDSGQRTKTLVDTEGHTTTEIKALEEERSSNRSNDRTIFENLPSGCRWDYVFFAGGQWPGTAVWILNCSFETQEWSQTRPHKLQGFQVLFAPERPHGPMCPVSCPLCPFMPPKKKWLRFKRASTYYWELRCYANCCLRPPSRPWGFSFSDPDLLIFTKISVNPGKSLGDVAGLLPFGRSKMSMP